MTYKEINESKIVWSEACIIEKKASPVQTLIKSREAFPLRYEIELYLNMPCKTPFYIRSFPIKEKIIVEREMRKRCLFGILRKCLSVYSPHIMLIFKKIDIHYMHFKNFGHLISRLPRLQCTFPLVRDAMQILGASACELIKVINLKGAYHTLRLGTKSCEDCGITVTLKVILIL